MKRETLAGPVYVLHGWSKSNDKWQFFLKDLAKLGIKAKLLNIPGLTAKLNKPWNLNDYVKWFEDEVGDNRNVTVIAHSFGGRIAIRFDVKNPNRLKKLVLIDSAGIRPLGIGARLKRGSFKALASIGKKITQSDQLRKLLYTVVRERDYYEADNVMRKTMANIVEDDQRKELEFVKADTLIIWGQKDKDTPLSDARMMNKQITGSRMVIVPKAGHAPQFSHHKQVAKHVSEFLSH
jgi:pimeloyl-ACP methyl ester carboxylesterase